MFFNPSRDEARQFFFETWKKYSAGHVLTDLEKMTAAILVEHPEYAAIFQCTEKNKEKEYFPEQGETNPFLHIGMHLAIQEQLSINQPPGICAFYTQLTKKHHDPHIAQHEIMECLGEMIWQAQRKGTLPDPSIYFACLQGKLGIDESVIATPHFPKE